MIVNEIKDSSETREGAIPREDEEFTKEHGEGFESSKSPDNNENLQEEE